MTALRKPLYLDVSQANEVQLEAVALRVLAHERADSFYPLQRISRVVVTGRVEWQTEALLACLENGIPVAFRQRDGTLIGHCLSDQSSRTGLEILLQALADSPEGENAYHDWYRAELRLLVLRLAKSSGLHFPDLRLRMVEPQVQAQLLKILPCAPSLLDAQLQAPIRAHLAEILGGYGFSDNIHLPVTPHIRLVDSLEQLVRWEIRLRLLGGHNLQATPERGWRFAVVQYYQQQADMLEGQVRACLNRLWKTLKHREAD